MIVTYQYWNNGYNLSQELNGCSTIEIRINPWNDFLYFISIIFDVRFLRIVGLKGSDVWVNVAKELKYSGAFT